VGSGFDLLSMGPYHRKSAILRLGSAGFFRCPLSTLGGVAQMVRATDS